MANQAGLVSVSFRKNTVEEVVAAAKAAGLTAIEWGGDIHVPHGDLAAAQKAADLCREAGISITEYGSYYIIGKSEPQEFDKVVASAKVLGTDLIRVWPGQMLKTAELTQEGYAAMVSDAKRICDAAPEFRIALECHPMSLTEEYTMALKFLEDVGRENLKMFWQPCQYHDLSYNLSAIDALLPHVQSVHVFNWTANKDNPWPNRFPLAQGEQNWKCYLEKLTQKDGLNYMLEFMPDDSIDSLSREAATLKGWLGL